MDNKERLAIERWLGGVSANGLAHQRLAATHLLRLLERVFAAEGGQPGVLDGQPVSGRDDGDISES
jgi:hypothetical protein